MPFFQVLNFHQTFSMSCCMDSLFAEVKRRAEEKWVTLPNRQLGKGSQEAVSVP